MLAFLQAFSRPALQASACAPRVRRMSIHLMQSDGAIFTTKGGILHSSQVKGSRLWRQLAQCQEAVAHALAYTALYNSPNQEILGKPLDQITMRKVAFASAMMTTPFFALFGWTWFYLSAIMGLFTIMNYIFSVTLRIIGLWKERGFGWWLLVGLWAAYNLLLLPTTVVKNIMVFNRVQADRALPTSTNGSAPGKADNEVSPLQGGTGSNHDGTRKPDDAAAADSPYSSAAHLLVQAREMLALQQRKQQKDWIMCTATMKERCSRRRARNNLLPQTPDPAAVRYDVKLPSR
jgi:hypothetical protein